MRSASREDGCVGEDLGVGRGGGRWKSLKRWAAFSKRLVKSGCPVIAIVPYAPHRRLGLQRHGLTVVYWGTKTPSGTKTSVREFARALSAAALLDRALVRETRVKLFPEADAGLEAQFLLSEYVAVSNASIVTLYQHLVRELRAELTANHGERRRVLTFLSEYRRRVPTNPMVELEEELVAASLEGETKRVEAAIGTLIRTLIENDTNTLLARRAAAVCNEMSERFEELSLSRQLRFAAEVRLGITRGTYDASSKEYVSLLPSDTDLGVRWKQGNLVTSDSVRSDDSTIRVPATVPRHLMVGRPNQRLKPVQVWPGREDLSRLHRPGQRIEAVIPCLH
jgi:hypothetical protein